VSFGVINFRASFILRDLWSVVEQRDISNRIQVPPSQRDVITICFVLLDLNETFPGDTASLSKVLYQFPESENDSRHAPFFGYTARDSENDKEAPFFETVKLEQDALNIKF
jgi:hypothetical protein